MGAAAHASSAQPVAYLGTASWLQPLAVEWRQSSLFCLTRASSAAPQPPAGAFQWSPLVRCAARLFTRKAGSGNSLCAALHPSPPPRASPATAEGPAASFSMPADLYGRDALTYTPRPRRAARAGII